MSLNNESFLSGFHFLRVKLKLFALEDVAISSARLSRTGTNTGQQTLLRELVSDLRVNNSVLCPLSNSCLGTFRSLFIVLLNCGPLLHVEINAIVLIVPFAERSGIDLNDAVLHQCVSADQLVVGGIVNDIQDSCLPCAGF